MRDVVSEPEMPLNRQLAAAFAPDAAGLSAGEAGGNAEIPNRQHPSQRAGMAAILLFWTLQFIYFSLDKFFRGDALLSSTVAVRAVVSAIGALISFQILKMLQRTTGASFARRAIISLAIACAGSAVHSVVNWALFFAVNGPADGGRFSLATELAAYPPLFYLFSWVYLAITVILLSITYGGEIVLREHRIDELTREADAAREGVHDAHIWLRSGPSRVRVDVSAIAWISAEGECVRFHCGDRSFLERLSMRAAAEKLDGLGFVRIHRSTLVNSQRIDGVTRTDWGAMKLRLTDGTELRVSKSFQPQVRKLAERLKS
jgi:DNA-binding LytR/AlgR family response regulator